VIVRIDRIHSRSEAIPPQAGSQSKDPSYFWRIVVTDGSQSRNLFVVGSAGARGRDYYSLVGQEFDLTLKGGVVSDRDGSVWEKAKLEKVGAGGSAAAPQAASGRPPGAPAASRVEVPRDVYAETSFKLLCENYAIGLGVAKGMGIDRTPTLEAALLDHASKAANMMLMDWNVRSNKLTSAKLAEREEAARKQREAEEQARREAEERRRAEEAQRSIQGYDSPAPADDDLPF